ncbi:hypothetical protein [uncultured Draconibacterium sp.]|uniref:hypothetical protein n=1 Tax=uncultured Draconibacterium sp. TaxID=1573823 RepID=UPI0026011640|nr:hypothetical protein [uncultured Draconibacterium sp.]
MKKINFIYLLILLAAFVSCEEDYVAPNSFSDVSWYSPQHQSLDENYPIIGQGQYYSISDLSQGELSHQWELLDPNIYFLGGTLVRNDSTLEEKIIGGGNIGDISEDKTVHLYFPEGGIQSVRLYNTFDDTVSFVAEDTVLYSYYDEALGVHVFDHTFTVDVYFDVVADYLVYDPDLNVIDLASATDTLVITIEAGQALHFAQKVDSIYHITDVTWNIPGGSPQTSFEDSVKVTFYVPGTYSNLRFTASRNAQNIPSGSDRDTIPLKVVVEPSSAPFLVAGVTKINSNSVRLQLSGQAAGTLSKSDFTVTARNADKGEDFAIGVASVNMIDDRTALELTFADPIYSNDEVIIEYSGSELMSTDGRTIEPATVTLDPIDPENLVTDPGFENGADTWVSPPEFDGGRVTDAANYSTDMPKDGSYSMHAIKAAGGQTAFANSNGFVLEQGVTYTYSYDYYGVSSSKQGGAWEARISELLDNGLVKEGKLFGGWTGLNGIKIGEWTKKTATLTGDGKTYAIAMLMYGASSAEVYYDNFSITVKDDRP